MTGELVDEPGLPDTGFAGNHDQATASGLRVCERVPQALQRDLPAHKRVLDER